LKGRRREEKREKREKKGKKYQDDPESHALPVSIPNSAR
jgi:hypothetical protein